MPGPGPAQYEICGDRQQVRLASLRAPHAHPVRLLSIYNRSMSLNASYVTRLGRINPIFTHSHMTNWF